MTSVPIKRHYSIREYLEFEQQSDEKHEYYFGQVISMAGGTIGHSLITTNLLRELGNALKGKACRAFDSNLRTRIPRKPLYKYPDATVICGPPEFDADDPKCSVTNPRLLAEVLSASTEGYDRGEKFSHYREIGSFQEYVLISQDVPRIETFYRHPDGTWVFRSVSSLDARVHLASLEIELALAEIYAGVDFPPPDEPVIVI